MRYRFDPKALICGLGLLALGLWIGGAGGWTLTGVGVFLLIVWAMD
jgi:hypothetical protein